MAANLPGAPVDRDDVADGGAAVADARVERAEGELEAAALALLDPRDDGVEAPGLAVDLDDVALRDALRRKPLRADRAAGGRRGEEARLLHRARDANAGPGRLRRPRPTRAGAARLSRCGPSGRAAASSSARARRRPPARARRAARVSSPARRTRVRTRRRRARSPGRSAWRRAPRTRRPAWRPAGSRRSRRRRCRRERS